ncbi:hypothetical protein D3C80_2063070 [compost metagenome]
MVVGATDDLGVTGNHGLERLDAGAEIDHLKLKSLFFEVALLQCDRQWQIVEERVAADRQGELGALQCRHACRDHEHQAERQVSE